MGTGLESSGIVNVVGASVTASGVTSMLNVNGGLVSFDFGVGVPGA